MFKMRYAKMKRIKHNDLTHYFLRDHDKLPAGYLKSVEKFLISYKLQARVGPPHNVQGHKEKNKKQ